MRITNGIIQRTALANLQMNMRRMFEAQETTASGKRIRTISDDPIGASQVMQADGSLRALDQYKRNIASATSRVDAEESALDSLTTILERAKELGIGAAVSSASPATRAAGKAEVDQLLAAAVQLGNRQHEGEYLFGGVQSTTIPFQGTSPPFAAAPPTGTRQTEISESQYLTTNHNGTEVFLDTNVLGALNALSTALGANDIVGIQTSLNALDSAHDAVQNLIGDVGARSSQLEVTSSNLTALDTQLRTFKSVLEDADTEKAVTDLVSRQNTYQAAMLATSRVMSLNLASYLT
jgi:flagellar hook-associated protein 3 FlgL